MFIFAHFFAGALLGLVFWHLTNDRRAIIVCIAGSILPDLIDKPLGLLYPYVLGSGRTVFHSLGSVCIIFIVALLIIRSRNRLLGISVAGAVFLHQVMDEMWSLPSNWLYPLLGPFQGFMIPDYIGAYFWFEITNPSEWFFMFATGVVLATSYPEIVRIHLPSSKDRMNAFPSVVVIIVCAIVGFSLVAAGLLSPADTIITPFYNQVTNVMAGLLSLSMAVAMRWEKNTAVYLADPHNSAEIFIDPVFRDK
jgi:hypothetical protein